MHGPHTIPAVHRQKCGNGPGFQPKKAAWIGGLSGTVYLTVIEFLDAHSAKWGWSWGDMAANISWAPDYSSASNLDGKNSVFNLNSHFIIKAILTQCLTKDPMTCLAAAGSKEC